MRAFPWAVQVGPERFAWDAPATGSLRDVRIGLDTPDLSRTVLLRELGATAEEQIRAAGHSATARSWPCAQPGWPVAVVASGGRARRGGVCPASGTVYRRRT